MKLAKFLKQAASVLNRLDALLPPEAAEPDWRALAYRWQSVGRRGVLESLPHPHTFALSRLAAVDTQMQRLVRNTEQFLEGRPANNVLMSGARGTGKSSLIRACLHAYADQGLRLIEVDKADLTDLPDIVEVVAARPEYFIIYCDDLSFEEGEPGYKAMKSILDGSVSAATPNVLVYATSNRRHLLPEYLSDNLQTSKGQDGEIHPGEVVEEKISLSERFGLWVSFYPFSQDEYLTIVAQWLSAPGVAPADIESARPQALVWALERGSRSGRVAHQFARDYAGRNERPVTVKKRIEDVDGLAEEADLE